MLPMKRLIDGCKPLDRRIRPNVIALKTMETNTRTTPITIVGMRGETNDQSSCFIGAVNASMSGWIIWVAEALKPTGVVEVIPARYSNRGGLVNSGLRTIILL